MIPVLVTGTSGLVGFQVAQQLSAAGADVLGLDVKPPPADASFRHVIGDVSDLDAVTVAMQGRSHVVHAGAISGPMLMQDNPHGIATANLGGAMTVFEAVRRCGVLRLVWLSSIAVYGDQPTLDAITEDTRPNPQSFYGHTKLAGEILLHGYVSRYGMNAVALRLSSVFGPRRQTACALRSVIEAGLAGRPATVAAENSSFRQYIHVDDAARAVCLALEADKSPGFAYNITGGTYVTEAELAREIAALVPGLAIQPGPPAWNEGHLGPLLIDPAARDLGFTPRVTLREGLAELVGHIKGAGAVA